MNIILKELTKQIEAANLAYREGHPFISDFEYDRLVEQAKKLGYVESVGAAPVDDIDTIEHEHPMLSLAKCHTREEVEKFINGKEVTAMYKADGLTVSCTYIDGILTRLETRGNGSVGNNIMFHAKSIENLPIHIGNYGKYVIDGECVILYDDFEKINSKLPENEKYKTPRNLAAGSLNLHDPAESAKRHLKFYAWDVIEGGSSHSLINNLNEAHEKYGFDIVSCIKNVERVNADDIKPMVLDYLREQAKFSGFPIDGIVLKYDNIDYYESLGAIEHNFRGAIAYKFEDDRYPTKLLDVEWTMGKSGQLTPVLIFEPVEISGTMVEKCSAHNISILKSLGLTKGCTIYTYKANDIIPQCDAAEEDGDGEIEIPATCPVCGSPTRILKENDSEVLLCTNDSCPGKMLGLFKHFVSKEGMDIDGLSEQTLQKFMKLGFIGNKFADIYHLKDHKKELYKLEGFGKKSVDNLLNAIEESKNGVDFVSYITAFSIPNIGRAQSKAICKTFKTFDEFYAAAVSGYDFSKIDGIGRERNKNICNWIKDNGYQMTELSELINFEIEEIMNPPTGGTSLYKQVFCITGNVMHFKNRDELKEKIELLGGKVSGSVSSKTNYLINNDTESLSSKNKKAKALGIPIISEEEFLAMIGE